MKKSSWVILTIVVILLGYLFYKGFSGEQVPGKYDDFAKCISEKKAIIYGAYWCPHCADQKKMFGSSFQYVNYVECDPRGKNAQPQTCTANGIKGYPTWIINGEIFPSVQELEQLAATTGCELPVENVTE